MLSPSDFNNAVPQFTNGNYASNPINPQYIAEPDAENYNRGTEPLQTLPAQWWNWFINKFTARFNKVNIYVKNIFNELAQVLSIFNITPDGTEQTPTTSQLKTVFETCYPQYVKTAANLVGTETTVNGHPLSSNVTVTRSDLGLGTSATVNTGTAVGCIPTVGTALGTTNNNILVTDSTGKLKPSGITVGTAAGCDATLFARKTEVDALYGNTVGTALGTAAVGTCTTFARSDHVHPVTGLATTNNCGTAYAGLGAAGDYVNYIRTPQDGLLPYCEDAVNGKGYIGTPGWPFYEMNAKRFRGNLSGSASHVNRNAYTGAYTFSFALFDNITTVENTPLYVSATCSLTYNPATGNLVNNGLYSVISSDWSVHSCIGHLNNDYLHIYTDAPSGIAMNKSLLITQGNVIAACFCGSAAYATEANCACYARCLHFEQLTNNTACPVYYFYANGNTYLCATGPAMVWITNPYGTSSSSPSIYKAGTSLMHNGERDPGLSYIKF